MCRHAVGLNHVAIGIEFVQAAGDLSPREAARQVLARRAQVTAGVALVAELQARFGITDQRVIGHAMANGDPAFKDRSGWRNDHVDWEASEVRAFRARLVAAR
jgi:N-acetyl-anhydromuramyl-L-alanine amidase AmpD